MNRQLEVAGIAGTSTPSPATSNCRLGVGSIRPLQRPKAGGLRPQPRWSPMTLATRQRLLDFDRGAGRFQVLLDLLGFFLRSAFLDRATGFGQILGFLQAQAGDRADHLDDLDLLVAGRLQDHVELGLLFDRGGSSGRTGSHGDRGGGGHAELLFHRLDQLHHLDEGLAADRFDDLFVGKGHLDTSGYLMLENVCGRLSTELLPQAAFCWPTALVTRATCEAGSASTRTRSVAGWTMTLRSVDTASSRVGSEARTSTWVPGYFCPPIATRRGFNLSFALANSLIRRPAAPGSSFEKAYSRGPVSSSWTMA